MQSPSWPGWPRPPASGARGRVREYIEITRRARQGEKVSVEGKYYSSTGFKMPFKPSGRRIPIYLAAFGPQMSRLAGRLTDGVLINMASPTEVRRIINEIRQGAEEAGTDPARLEVICKLRCSLAADHNRTRAALR